MVLSAEHIQKLRSAITMLLDRTASFLKTVPTQPVAGSLLQSELTTASRPESITTALSIGDLALEFAADHLSALEKLVVEPIETMPCFTSIRSMLEMTAIGAWVLDPSISSQERVARVYAIRFEAIDQQLKFGRCISVNATEIQKLETRTIDLENEAVGLGYQPIRNKKNAIIGIGTPMPGATDMIRDVLNDEWMYRLLSGVAHGHHWAIIQLGFQDATPKIGSMDVQGIPVTGYEKKVYVDGIALVGLHGILAFARLFWNKCRYNGWDILKVEEILEDVADTITAQPIVRFWRSP
jgi:hypothetical protein